MAKRSAGQPVTKKASEIAVVRSAEKTDAGGLLGTRLNGPQWLTLGGLLLAGLLLRLIFLSAPGHETDIGTFEAWTTSLAQYGAKGFYAHTNFVDYPPGYMLVLWLVGQIYRLIVANAGSITSFEFMALVKLPAILADLGIAYLTYLIARRTWSSGKAFLAVAIVAFNPAIWFVSAYWGQADSVAAVFLVWALYLALTQRFEFAWGMLALAVLIKPQPLVVWPLLLFWQVRRQGWTWRLALIPVVTLGVAYIGSLPFSPSNDPPHVWQWLYLRYHTGTQVYPYNSANAFNLYSIVRDMWQPDTAIIFFMPQWVWGVLIFTALTVALTMRQWRMTAPGVDPNVGERTVYMAWFLALLGLFMLTTRMHERYMFSALAVAPLIWNIGRTQRVIVTALSITFIINLLYALQYLKTPSADLNPPLVHSMSFINVLCLFVLAGAFLIEEMGSAVERRLTGTPPPDGAVKPVVPTAAKRSPLASEGLIGMSRLDYLIALGLTVAGGLFVFYNLGIPNSRIFDEVYFARAAQEYLHNQPQFEWTHPPLTKLLMAASQGIFKWLPDPTGARVAAATFGTLAIPLLYAFAKRLFSSTAVAVLSVFFLLTSGYWYVQSRIATPEIFIAFFSMATLYCFYRLVISSQIVKRQSGATTHAVSAALFAVLAIVWGIFAAFILGHEAPDASKRDLPIAFVLAFAGFATYCLGRFLALRSAQAKGVIYADGTIVEGATITFPTGERVPLKNASMTDGDRKTDWRADSVELSDANSKVSWRADGTIAATIVGRTCGDGQLWAVWLTLTAIAVACLVTSKWEGFFCLAAIWFAATLVAGQRWLPKLGAWFGSAVERARFLWGNPFGVRWPLFIAASIAVTLVIYLLSYIPTYPIGDSHAVQGAGLPAVWDLQKQMYWYHHNLVATHPYASKWWTWPLELRPVSYYYQTYSRPGVTPQIVGEVIALPNPAVWLMGLLTVPLAAWYGWRDRHKGVMLLVTAYAFQWLPWALSPRIDFEYNFYPNLAIICLCTAYVLGKWWSPAPMAASAEQAHSATVTNRALIGVYLAVCLLLFVYFFPILSAQHITYQQWMARMWLPQGAPNWWGWI